MPLTPPRQASPASSNITDNESNSSYCLLSNNDLHFLPYSNSGTPNGSMILDKNYSLYSSFLNNKTVSSFDSHHGSSENFTINDTSGKESPIVKLLDNYESHAIFLPDHFIPLEEDDDQIGSIKQLLLDIFSHWKSPKDIKVKKLTGGITNMLLECTYTTHHDEIETVLVRTYGNGTDLIIDRDREFVSHLVLHSLNLAPAIHARFGNGLVYGFISGRSLEFLELSDDKLYPLIASKLACLHKLASIDIIDESLFKLKQKFYSQSLNDQDIWSVLLDWTEKLPELDSMLELCQSNKDICQNYNPQSTLKSILFHEVNWLKEELGKASVAVISHNDLLSGNIIVPEDLNTDNWDSLKSSQLNPISFIDYEYMMPAPRAFDIANHFMEWQGFDCDKGRIPQFIYNPDTHNYENETVFNWCQYYLSAFHSSNPDINPYYPDNEDSIKRIDSKLVQHLVNEIAYHYGMPGLYWGIWAGIQSKISLIDFDYANYSCERLIEYWNWKRTFLINKRTN
ncbi:hypothetical protein CANINC_001241 [Pichia inconspicua]|uniref:ethanolamine kinase n=1 Tax=Pichia inconspicua TaxID=52247 RepID=A0A4T0X5Y0_9ASCO|nr:hypothetical protein CANINC_001241 [[Candida] inconspicua]